MEAKHSPIILFLTFIVLFLPYFILYRSGGIYIMKKTRLGRTNLTVTRVGFGALQYNVWTWKMPGIF